MAEQNDPNIAEQDVRLQAEAFADSIEAARRAGYTVTWPSSVDGLRAIQISATGRVPAPAEPEPAPAEVPARAPAPARASTTAPAGTVTKADTVGEAMTGAVKGS